MEDYSKMSSEDFFRNQLYKQMLDANAGMNTVMQALVGKVGEKVIEGGDTDGAIKSLKELTDVTKQMQLNTIEIKNAMSESQ